MLLSLCTLNLELTIFAEYCTMPDVKASLVLCCSERSVPNSPNGYPHVLHTHHLAALIPNAHQPHLQCQHMQAQHPQQLHHPHGMEDELSYHCSHPLHISATSPLLTPIRRTPCRWRPTNGNEQVKLETGILELHQQQARACIGGTSNNKKSTRLSSAGTDVNSDSSICLGPRYGLGRRYGQWT